MMRRGNSGPNEIKLILVECDRISPVVPIKSTRCTLSAIVLSLEIDLSDGATIILD